MRSLRSAISSTTTSLFFSLCVGYGCTSQQPTKYSAVETHFGQYLKDHFNRMLPPDSAYYVLINEDGCSGCIQRTINHFLQDPRCTFIYSAAAKQRFIEGNIGIATKSQMLIDTSGAINRLRYNNGNIGVLAVSKGHIDTVYALDATNTDAILDHLKN